MYLPNFFKTKNELQAFRTLRYSKMGPALALWGVWAFYPSLYNLVYTDIFPPAKGEDLYFRGDKKNRRVNNLNNSKLNIIHF
jgi:hypothetical protein